MRVLFVWACAFAALSGCNNSDTDKTPADNGAPATALPASNGATNAATVGLEPKTVTVGYLPVLSLPQPLIGFQEGEFTRRINGIAFQEKTFPNDASLLQALRAGQIDVAYGGPVAPTKAFAQKRDLVLLGGCAVRTANAQPQGVYVTRKRFVQENPNFTRAFVEMNRALLADLNADRAKAERRMLEAYGKASGKKVDASARAQLKALTFSPDVDAAALKRATGQSGARSGFVYDLNAAP